MVFFHLFVRKIKSGLLCKKIKHLIISCFVLFLLFSNAVYAINFDAEKVYQSVLVVYTEKGMGSGFAIGSDCIVTNAHVIKNAKTILLSVYKGKDYSAEIIKSDAKLDLAILKILDKKLPHLKIAEENQLQIGADVYAIGAPKDMPYTLTKGIISAKERIIGGETYLQTDASINPGNSGGPLVNADGEVVGVNTLKISSAEGIGMAIPMHLVMDFLKKNHIDITAEGETDFSEAESNQTKSKEAAEQKTEQEQDTLEDEIFQLKVMIVILMLTILVLFVLLLLSVRKNLKVKKSKMDRIEPKEYDFEIEIEE